jgi:hypothetical protein
MSVVIKTVATDPALFRAILWLSASIGFATWFLLTFGLFATMDIGIGVALGSTSSASVARGEGNRLNNKKEKQKE